MSTVNEKSPIYITINFKDEVGDPLIPTTVDWRLDDVTHDTETEIVAWTALTSPAATMTLVVPGSNNAIVDEDHIVENRVLGVRADSGLGSEAHAEIAYDVINLVGPTGP